ncbi:MAG: exonuclease SbcCD subunit D [Oscillospiraceae bacterium]
MRELKILHAADLHLDSPFEALSDSQAKLRRREQRLLPGKVIEAAETQGADLILLAGDLFDSGRPYHETAQVIEEAFAKVEIPIFIAPGNHDYYSPASPWARMQLRENVHIFKTSDMACIDLGFARVYGAGFTEPYVPDLLAGFNAVRESDIWNILILHGDLGGGGYCPITEQELAKSGAHYAALGHIHAQSGLKKAGDTWYSYPGCTEGRGFDECGPRGAALITLSDRGCESKFLELCARRYEIINVDVSNTDVRAALFEAVSSAREGDICRFVLTGECGEAVPARELEELAQKRGLFAAQLRDRTKAPRKIDGEGEDTLRGTFLRLARARYDSAQTESERQSARRAILWGLAAIDGGEEPWEVSR